MKYTDTTDMVKCCTRFRYKSKWNKCSI